jgi:hypothetical protein
MIRTILALPIAILVCGCIEPNYRVEDPADTAWMMDTCDLFPNMFPHGTTLGGSKSFMTGSATTENVGFGQR